MADNSAITISKDYALNTVIHGLPHIISEKIYWRKILWGLIFFTLFGVSLWQITLNFESFLRFPYDTSIEIVTDRNQVFPAVTICNMNPVQKSKIRLVPALLNFTQNVSVEEALNAGLLVNFPDIYGSLDDETQVNIGYKLEDTLISCSWNHKPCRTSDFILTTNPTYGNCYTYNQNGTKLVSSTNPDNGLIIVLYVGAIDYVTGLFQGQGYSVTISNQTNYPFPGNGGLLAASGAYTEFSLSKKIYLRPGLPWLACVNSQDNRNKNVYSKILPGVEYTKEGCLMTCLQNYIIDKCNCILPGFMRYRSAFGAAAVGANMCTTNDGCSMGVKGQMQREPSEIGCSDEVCPNPCQTTEVNAMITSVSWPGDSMRGQLEQLLEEKYPKIHKIIQNFTTEERMLFMSNNFIKMNFYVNSFEYTAIVMSGSYGYESFLSDIGGTLGLYIGVSLAAVIEFIMFLIDFLMSFLPIKQHKSNEVTDFPKPI